MLRARSRSLPAGSRLDIARRDHKVDAESPSLPRPTLLDALGMESTRWSRLAVLYASTIFVSAFCCSRFSR